MSRFDTIKALSKDYRSVRTTIFRETFGLMAVIVIALTVTTFVIARSQLQSRAYADLQSLAHQRATMLQTLMSTQRQQVALASRDPKLLANSSLTDLLGFRTLLSVNARTGDSNRISGQDISADLLPMIISGLSRSSSSFVPLFSVSGWSMYAIAVPQADGRHQMVAVFDAQPLEQQILHADSTIGSKEVQIIATHDGEVTLLHAGSDKDTVTPVSLDSLGVLSSTYPVIDRALHGETGVAAVTDYSGVNVLLAYEPFLPLGWAMTAQIDRSEIESPIMRFALALLAAGFSIVGMLSFVMFSLSVRISAPLEELASKLDGIEVRHWKFKRSVFTGNEIEVLDSAAFDLTKRLREAHVYLESVVRDRTRELIQQHAQDEAIFQSIEYGLLVTDKKGKVILMNNSAEVLTGWRTELALSQPFEKVLRIVDKELHAISKEKHPVEQVLHNSRKYTPASDPKFSLFHKNGTLTPLSLRVAPIMHGKRCTGSVAVFRDTTEDRRIDTMKSDFISLVSHQLRTPLSAMNWYLELLTAKDAGPLTEQQKGYVEEATLSNHRMVRLVEVLLNVSRIELGKFAVTPKEIDVLTSLRHMIHTFDREMKAKNIHVVLEQYEHMDHLHIRSDPILFQLITENLIGNAIKYSNPDSSVRVHVRVMKDKRQVAISVHDTGIGIPVSQQKHMFEKLFRADNARKSDTDGNGLGLYISRIAADMLHAKISFDSSEKKGTSFTLTMPMDAHRHVHSKDEKKAK